MPGRDKCKKCGAPLKWVQTKNLKWMPLDAKPQKMIQVKEGRGEVIDVYMPHWSTCPNAKDFKKPKPKKYEPDELSRAMGNT